MRQQDSDDPGAIRLISWKEIAAFLGRDERTAKRWEGSRGLPVRRVPGSGRAAVFAYPHELRAWLDGDSVKEPSKGQPPGIIPTPSSAKSKKLPVARLIVGLAAFAATGFAAFFWYAQNFAEQGSGGAFGKSRNTTAVSYYQSGLHSWQTRSPSGLQRAIGDFTNAIRADPNYAQAYMGLANTYNLLCEYTSISCSEAYAKAAASARRALSLDGSLAGAHAALAFDDFYGQRDSNGALREFARAIALDPRDATTHHWYATFLMSIGEFGHARSEIDKAAELDSESAAIVADKALILFFAGEKQQAIRLLKQIESDQPLFASPHLYLSNIALMEGDDAGYLREMTLLADTRHDAQLTSLAIAGRQGLERRGHLGMLKYLLDARLALYAKGKASAYSVSLIQAMLGKSNEALSYLTISIAHSEPELIGAKINPLFAPLRGLPEFQRLLTRAGFRFAQPPSR